MFTDEARYALPFQRGLRRIYKAIQWWLVSVVLQNLKETLFKKETFFSSLQNAVVVTCNCRHVLQFPYANLIQLTFRCWIVCSSFTLEEVIYNRKSEQELNLFAFHFQAVGWHATDVFWREFWSSLSRDHEVWYVLRVTPCNLVAGYQIVGETRRRYCWDRCMKMQATDLSETSAMG